MDWRSALQAWIDATSIAILNVAGPRPSGAPAIGLFTAQVLDALADMAAVHGSCLDAGLVQSNGGGVSGGPPGLRG
jgi:hypothetical protein